MNETELFLYKSLNQFIPSFYYINMTKKFLKILILVIKMFISLISSNFDH